MNLNCTDACLCCDSENISSDNNDSEKEDADDED